MTVAYDTSHRGWQQGSTRGAVCLQDKFEVMKDIGDGSFGSVALARVRSGGAHVARRGTLVAIKTMKKTFDSFAPCLELREVIFLRTLPNHPHLVPALDIFLDPLSHKLHIAMEYMDGNLYQLMKAREHKPFDGSSVKSILFQILLGLEHIHDNGFFHRDIKPENILVSVSAREELGSAFKRYSALVTPPSTPPTYTIKIADFGLAREMHSRLPYTTYVSTRWYRAPEVLLRAGEYSAPVDMWAIGAMAVEIATLKPLFPGGNEVDQVWKVCDIMGSPGNWVNKQGARVGGGEWKEGIKLAHKLGFSFPKMAPHTIDGYLPSPQWPAQFRDFVTWCLLWDPKKRPTSTQSLAHEYFAEAFDPLRPKSSRSAMIGRKHSDMGLGGQQAADNTALASKGSSWFRKSLVARESAPAVPQHVPQQAPIVPSSPVHALPAEMTASKVRPTATKRNTWTNGPTAAPMPILPSIRPVSPLPNTVTASATHAEGASDKSAKKIGRQLSQASHGNHYSDVHRQDAERALNGHGGLASPTSSAQQKESFFSHLRKRARRLSGRHQLPQSPRDNDEVANAGCAPWNVPGYRNSLMEQESVSGSSDMDKALQNVRYSLDASNAGILAAGTSHMTPLHTNTAKQPQRTASNPMLKRHHSLPTGPDGRSSGRTSPAPGANSKSTRRAAHRSTLPSNQYETPDEQEELLDEALASAHAAVTRLDRQHNQRYVSHPNDLMSNENARPPLRQAASEMALSAPYPTPSPSANRNSVVFGNGDVNVQSKPIDINQIKSTASNNHQFPTPPYEENEWAAAAAASIFAATEHWR